MSSDSPAPEEIAHQYSAGYNEHDEEKVIELFSPTITWEGETIDRDKIEASVWWEASPDLRLERHQVISDGSEAAFRFTVMGTHEQPC